MSKSTLANSAERNFLEGHIIEIKRKVGKPTLYGKPKTLRPVNLEPTKVWDTAGSAINDRAILP